MEDFFIFIGIIAIGAVVLYLIYIGLQEKDDKAKENEELFQYVGDEDEFDNKLSRAKNIEKKLSEPGVRQKAEEIRKQALRNRAKNEEEDRKQRILTRTYSYQYEDVIYQIFSPLAVKLSSTYKGQTWRVSGYIDMDFFCGELCRILKVSRNEGYRLIAEFGEKGLISINTPPNLIKKYCYMGYFLQEFWNIISSQDNNFSKWMDSHNDVETKEDFCKREQDFLKDFKLWQ